MDFASPFDEQLARSGTPAIFLFDHKDCWRMEPQWTRDCWGRCDGPHEHGWRFAALRDRGTGFVWVVLVTSPTLLVAHPRLDVKLFPTLEAAQAERDRYGSPAKCEEAW